jgi:hypothetical protein
MRLIPYSYRAVRIDGSGAYTAKITAAENEFITPATPSYTKRTAGYFPDLAGKEMSPGELTLAITFTTTPIGDGFDYLKALFSTQDTNQRQLICTDADNSNEQMYVYGFPKSMTYNGGRLVFITLALKSPIWLTVSSFDTITPASTGVPDNEWPITATGQKATVNINQGNIQAFPVITITPGASDTEGFTDVQFVKTYNYTQKTGSGYHTLITTLDTQQAAAAGGLIADSNRSHQINNGAGITATQNTIPIDTAVGLGLPAKGMGFIVDAGKNEQISWTANSGSLLSGVTRGIGGTGVGGVDGIGYTHADNKIIYYSHAKANLADVRVRYNPKGYGNTNDIAYWFDATTLNSASTKIWANLSYSANADFEIRDGISDVDDTMVVKNVPANIKDIPAVNGLLLVESELIGYSEFVGQTGYNQWTFTGMERGMYGTSASAHISDVTCHITAELQVYHGNKDLSAPVYGTAAKPLLDMANSTNSSWIFLNFAAPSTQQSAKRWSSSGAVANKIYLYSNAPTGTTAPGPAFKTVDPATNIGCGFAAGASGTAQWYFNSPFGLRGDGGAATITAETVRRFNLPTGKAVIQTSITLSGGSENTAVAATSAVNTWQVTAILTHTAAAACNFATLKMVYATNATNTRISGVDIAKVTLALSTVTTSPNEGVPYVVALTRRSNVYNLACTITNETTGQGFSIDLDNMALTSSVEVDTLNKTCFYVNGTKRTPRFDAITWSSTRSEWLPMFPGNNTLRYDEVGVSDVVVTVDWQGRNN